MDPMAVAESRTAEFTSHTVELAGVPVHYADFGGEGDPILLVHGLGGSHLNWLAAAPLLRHRGHVLAVDLAGFGRTPALDRGASVHSNRELIDLFIAEVCRGSAVYVGNSMGGLLGMMQAAARPSSIRSLVLVNPALPGRYLRRVSPIALAFMIGLAFPKQAQRVLERRWARLGVEKVVEETFRLVTRDPRAVDADLVRAHVDMQRELVTNQATHAAFVEAAASLIDILARRRKFFALVRRIAAPTLLVHGPHDRLVPIDSARWLARRQPHWRLEVIDGVGHVPMLEAPQRFAAVVNEFLDEVEALRARA